MLDGPEPLYNPNIESFKFSITCRLIDWTCLNQSNEEWGFDKLK